jgi:hypothetical protein
MIDTEFLVHARLEAGVLEAWIRPAGCCRDVDVRRFSEIGLARARLIRDLKEDLASTTRAPPSSWTLSTRCTGCAARCASSPLRCPGSRRRCGAGLWPISARPRRTAPGRTPTTPASSTPRSAAALNIVYPYDLSDWASVRGNGLWK